MTDKPYYDIVIPGDYFCDIIFTGAQGFPELGKELYTDDVNVVLGGTLNSVLALHRLGVNIGWMGALGNDFFSHLIEHRVRDEGLDLSLVQRLDHPLRRVTVALSYPTDRAFITYCEPSDASFEGWFQLLERATFRHLHLPGLTVDERMLPLLDECRVQGVEISMDCQHREETLDVILVREILRRVDLFMPNASEACKLTACASLDEAMDTLADIIPYVVIKNGVHGAVAVNGGTHFTCPAVPANVIDTTGAGDVFNAGFLAAHLSGKTTDECLQWANYCGAMSVQGLGGTTSAPTLNELQTWLAEQPSQLPHCNPLSYTKASNS